MKITPSLLKGSLWIPSSKSQTMRAILFAALANSKSCIFNYLKSPDVMAMIEAIKAFGISIEVHDNHLEIEGSTLKGCETVIDAGNSGIILRFIGGLASLLPTYTIITGDHSIRHNRSIEPLLSAIVQLNGFAASTKNDGKAPIIIRGPIKPGHAVISGEDSQPVSALLIAASFLEGTTHLEVLNPGEKPWIDMTLSWIHRLGGKIKHENYERYTINGPMGYSGFEMNIPGDFSSAAFPLIAACVTKSQLTLKNIDITDIQGDKKIIALLQKMGAKIEMGNGSLTINGNVSLRGIKIDGNEIIDAIPILATLGCFVKGELEIVNAAIARKKESDRIFAIVSELRKMGANIEERQDGFLVRPTQLKGTLLNSHSDHRIALSLAVAALAAKGETTIQGFECISKSYPHFVKDFQMLGAYLCPT